MSDEVGQVSTTVEPPQYFYCLDHARVEELDGCRPEVRLGPYPTRERAANAIALAHERTDKWDQADEEWENG
jgi:hypothetical protein